MKTCNFYIIFCCVLLRHYGNGAPSEDLIQRMPHLDPPTNVPFKQYAGYLDTQSPRKLYYWFLESQSNPRTDPIVQWIPGGPGCSGLKMMLNYQGPWELYRTEGGEVRLAWVKGRPSWNSNTNLLYIDQPAGTGYSYSEDNNVTTDDTQIARDNHYALLDFFHRKFPEYYANDLYIFGESFGSSSAILLASRTVSNNGKLNIKGVGLYSGDYTDQDKALNSMLLYAHYHGLIGNKLWTRFLQTCCTSQHLTIDACNWNRNTLNQTKCGHALDDLVEHLGIPSLIAYGIYDKCAYGFNGRPIHAGRQETSLLAILLNKMCEPALEADVNIGIYLSDPLVAQAVHVIQKPGFRFRSCDLNGINYTQQTLSFKPQQLRDLMDTGVNVLIVHGDADMSSPFFDGMKLADKLGRKPVGEYRPWYLTDSETRQENICGFVQEYHNLTSATIMASGHMLSFSRPREAFTAMKRFVYDIPL
jgi:cathepsin A (carboxypeptidase C)